MARIISVSADQSQISTDITNPAADGVAVTTVYVTVLQSREVGGEPLPFAHYAASNVTVAVTPSTGVTITQPTGTADEFGTVTATFVSTNAATVSVSATAFGDAVTGNATVVVGGGAPPPVDPGNPFFEDDFSTGSRTNANGFTWNSTGASIAVTTTNPRAGQTHSLAFTFPASADGADSSREQRFNMGRDLDEMWLQYYLYVPANYAHRTQTSSGTNNKFLRIWGDSYNANNKIGASTFYGSSYGSDSFLAFERTFSGGGIGAQGSPEAEFGGTGDIPAGAWTQIRFHFKHSSSDGAGDQVMTMYADGVEVMTWAQPTTYGTPPYWNNGYFFGWSNSGYAEETVFQISEVKFYDTDPGWV